VTLDEYKTLFITLIMALILIAASPTLGFILPFPSRERFSELWVLGPGHMVENYPFNVRVGREYSVFVGIGCHMGGSTYYAVYVKFRNSTQPLPNATTSQPSPLPPFYEYQFFLMDGEEWERPLTFTIQNAQFHNRSAFIGDISINDTLFTVNCSSTWDSDDVGFFYQLFFELWLYDASLQGFRYHNRFVGIWLNITG